MSWKTRSADASPLGSGPAKSTATAGLPASAPLAAGKPVSGASGRVVLTALAGELARGLGEVGDPLAAPTGSIGFEQAASERPAAANTAAAAPNCRAARLRAMRQFPEIRSAGSLYASAGRLGRTSLRPWFAPVAVLDSDDDTDPEPSARPSRPDSASTGCRAPGRGWPGWG